MSPRQTEAHLHASRIERRLERAQLRAAERIRSRLPIAALEAAIRDRDLRTARRLLEETDFEDAHTPDAEILRDAWLRGGKVGAGLVRKMK